MYLLFQCFFQNEKLQVEVIPSRSDKKLKNRLSVKYKFIIYNDNAFDFKKVID